MLAKKDKEGASDLIIEPYKLLIYGKNGHFKFHRDTQRADGRRNLVRKHTHTN